MFKNISSSKQLPFIGRIGFIAISAILTSAVVIIFYNNNTSEANLNHFGNAFEVAALTLMPYMISAVIAAITVLCILNIIPTVRNHEIARQICDRLRAVSKGDLTGETVVKQSEKYMEDIVYEMNYSINHLNHTISKMKIINRQQWDILQTIKDSTFSNNTKMVMDMIDKMEENWNKIAELEETIKT
jgi:DNA-directed RNA polymerase subunit L